MNSKTRSMLNGLGMKLEPIVTIGKNGITDAVLNEIEILLETKELIKINLLKNSDLESRETARILATKTNSEVITAIGNKIVLYRFSNKKDVKHILTV